MRRIVMFLLMVSSINCYSQESKMDTLGIISRWDKSAIFNMDTIKISNNSTADFLLSLKGGTAKAIKIITISNTNSKYKIVSNTNPIPFTGLTGGKFEVVLSNNIVYAKITGNKTVIRWKLVIINLEKI